MELLARLFLERDYARQILAAELQSHEIGAGPYNDARTVSSVPQHFLETGCLVTVN